MDRTRVLQRELVGIVFDSTCAELKLADTFNQLLMLSNSQFIENRVYDDDDEVVEASKAKEEKEREEKEKESAAAASSAQSADDLVPKFTRALNAGLVALESFKVPEHVIEQLNAMA